MLSDMLPLFVDVPFRERRTYLHSTSIFDFLTARLPDCRNASLMFRQQIEHEIEAVDAARCASLDAGPARFTADTKDGPVDWALIEREPKAAVQRRERYDEDAVTVGSHLDGACIVSNDSHGASAIERVVALNKKLIQETVKPGKTLLFSKVVLREIPLPSTALKLCLKTRLGVRLFRTQIFATDKEIGELTFYGI